MLTLIGVLIVIVGFALRFNPLIVVTVAGIATGLAGQLSMEKILTTFGESFVNNRYLSLFILTLPIIGLLERYGLKKQAQALISKVAVATTGRLLMVYLFIREAAAAVGLTAIGGHAQMVRPLVSPMAEAAAENKYGNLTEKVRNRIKSMSAATDNVGLFFGEDIFIAFGAILLMKGVYEENGIVVEPIHMALWGIPTAIAAFIIHGVRLYLLDKKLQKEAAANDNSNQNKSA
ncbi:DUF969 domain-containing protein [Brevibacillus migulae]|uniref:DUF969 domain-containing protein n=1 Tax=Brevibacillus migulae TaxID=1644114 RepID=UPI00106EE46D|nr:DUF969 domain-containing protein [Brevibacillus migulae]